MSDELALAIYEKLKQKHGDNLPDPDHEPIQFTHCVKMLRHYEPEVFRKV
jgi:hypothetical protein